MTLTQTLMVGGGILTAAVLATYLIPAHVHVERTAFVPKPPEAVMALVASNAGYQTFNPYKNSDPNLKIDLFGPDAGIGSGFRFAGKEGKGAQTVTALTETSVTYSIDLGARGKPTQSIQVTPVDGGSKVTWDMDIHMGMNPVARVLGLFMDGMMGKTFDQGLKNLANA
ncbi:SRPBCC family protein [Actibacterium sp. 188UL27-1]|uniref:SRPBCC family protein n=1 Tax=Actibacterium sp. 188UL27-1 TaxID=2786961 RepID=UPI00195D6499|nr:SRPBCC family protein [Actibacterium sp. 188UL27-1]MBM7067589.1 SRPBCC family protein [Actibacterium sp. 188UL27-1]